MFRRKNWTSRDAADPTPVELAFPQSAPREHGIWASLARAFPAFRHRNYRLFFFGQMISLIGTWMQNVAQSWLVYILTGSPFYLGLISFVSAVPVLLVSPWAGIVADRVPKRNLLILTQSTMMALALVLAALAFPGWVRPWHIVVLSFLLGLANTFDAPARQAFVVELVGREDLMNAIAMNSALFNSARIIGPSLAGIVLAAFGPAWCFLLNGISFLAVIFGLMGMRVSDHPGPGVEHSPLAQLREGFQYVWYHRTVRTLIFMVAVSNLFASGYSVLLPALARDVLGGSEITLGLLTTAVGVGALMGALLVAVLRRPGYAGLLLRAASLLFPGLVIGLAFASQLPLALLLLVGIGVGFAVQNALANTMIQHLIPDALRGRVMSLYTLVFFGLFPVGALLSGGLAQALGVSFSIATGGGIALALEIIALRSLDPRIPLSGP